MSRAVTSWVGATDDTPVPPRVRIRVFDRFDQCCTICTRRIRPGETWTCEHVIALINGGANAESNLGVTCCNCLPDKNAADVAEKSSVYQKRAKHVLPKSERNTPRGFRKMPPGFKYCWQRKRIVAV